MSVRVRLRASPGLVPEPAVQREAHEAAEHAGLPQTRVLPRPEEDESAGRATGTRRTGTFLLLWRCVNI